MTPLRFVARAVTGTLKAADFSGVDKSHFAAALILTWLAGIGRYWDNPRVSTLQHLGLGSVAYVFVLSAFLWLLIWPLRPTRWKYFHVLTFVAAVAPPAFLYAIPVERFMTLDGARTARLWFLAVVATWRVILYFIFLVRYAELRQLRLFVAGIFPLTIIVFSLTVLNLERAVFDIMSGVDPSRGTSSDKAYAFLFTLSYYTLLVTPILALLYLFAIMVAYDERRAKLKTDSAARG